MHARECDCPGESGLEGFICSVNEGMQSVSSSLRDTPESRGLNFVGIRLRGEGVSVDNEKQNRIDVSEGRGNALVNDESGDFALSSALAGVDGGDAIDRRSGFVREAVASFGYTMAGPKKRVAELARRLSTRGFGLSATSTILTGEPASLADVLEPFLLWVAFRDGLAGLAEIWLSESSRDVGLDLGRRLCTCRPGDRSEIISFDSQNEDRIDGLFVRRTFRLENSSSEPESVSTSVATSDIHISFSVST